MLVMIVIVAATVILKPWEQIRQPQTSLIWFEHLTTLTLESTEDNLPIENVLIYAPFPQEFENLKLGNYSLISLTANGSILVLEGGIIRENTLPDRNLPTFSIEETQVGKRAAIRMDKMYPGDDVLVIWNFWAPENISIYDVPEENKSKVYVRYTPDKKIKLGFRVKLTYEEIAKKNIWLTLDPRYFGKLWWAWWYYYIEGPGWIDAPMKPRFEEVIGNLQI